jgi:hypothetical protein
MRHNATPVLCLLISLTIGCRTQGQVPGDWKSFPLGKGQVIVKAPATYQQSMEPKETLVLRPPNDPGITLRLDLHYLEGEDVPKDIGVQFVRAQAEKKKLAVVEKGNKVILTEVAKNEEKGKKQQVHFWQIGFENVVVVMSATILEDKRDAAEVKDCLEKTVPLIIESLNKK